MSSKTALVLLSLRAGDRVRIHSPDLRKPRTVSVSSSPKRSSSVIVVTTSSGRTRPGHVAGGVLQYSENPIYGRETDEVSFQPTLLQSPVLVSKLEKLSGEVLLSSEVTSADEIELPDSPWRYFTKPAGTVLIPLSKLTTTRARPKGIRNAEPKMRDAYDGKGSKRKPIDVEKSGSGYTVTDGNSTTAIARKHGWKSIPAIVAPGKGVSSSDEKMAKVIASKALSMDEGYDALQKMLKKATSPLSTRPDYGSREE